MTYFKNLPPISHPQQHLHRYCDALLKSKWWHHEWMGQKNWLITQGSWELRLQNVHYDDAKAFECGSKRLHWKSGSGISDVEDKRIVASQTGRHQFVLQFRSFFELNSLVRFDLSNLKLIPRPPVENVWLKVLACSCAFCSWIIMDVWSMRLLTALAWGGLAFS